jgi:hypothetical protein
MADMIKEVKDLMRMAVNWRKGFETWLDDSGDNEYVYQEFVDEIQTHLIPYASRLVEIEAISNRDASALVLFYFEQVDYLKELSRRMAAKDSPPVDLWR